jgi:hypothetical protein
LEVVGHGKRHYVVAMHAQVVPSMRASSPIVYAIIFRLVLSRQF